VIAEAAPLPNVAVYVIVPETLLVASSIPVPSTLPANSVVDDGLHVMLAASGDTVKFVVADAAV
jgi:hypothetical protein